MKLGLKSGVPPPPPPPASFVYKVDHGMGLIRSYLEDIGEWDNTVVLVFSDNGGVSALGSLNLPYRGEKGEYWEGGVRVPAVIAGGYAADSLASGLGDAYKYSHMVHITDIHATVMALAGVSNGADGGASSGAPAAPKSAKKDVLGAAEISGGKPTPANAKVSKNFGAGVSKSGGEGFSSVDDASAGTPTPAASSTPSPTSDDSSFETDGVSIWDAVMSTGDSVRTTMVLNVNSPLFASSGSVRHGRYKLIRNPDPNDNAIYSRVRASLLDYGFFVSPVKCFF